MVFHSGLLLLADESENSLLTSDSEYTASIILEASTKVALTKKYVRHERLSRTVSYKTSHF